MMGVQAHNTDPHPKVKAIMEAVKGKGADPRTMIRAAGKRGHELKNWPGRKEGDPVYCHEWVLGGCHQEGCTLVHDNANTPVELVDWLCKEVQPGVELIKNNSPNWIPPPQSSTGVGVGVGVDEDAGSRMKPHTCHN